MLVLLKDSNSINKSLFIQCFTACLLDSVGVHFFSLNSLIINKYLYIDKRNDVKTSPWAFLQSLFSRIGHAFPFNSTTLF